MRVVLIVGPSGSGKDSLLRGAREYFGVGGNLGFVRRYITRPPDGSEDNYYIDATGFQLLKRVNFFISSWEAHNNNYGIPSHSFDLKNGLDVVLVSISRSAIIDFEQQFDTVTTVEVTVQQDVLYQRLKRRGRESELDIQKRIKRAKQRVVARDLIAFDNSSNLNKSIANFVNLLEKLGSKMTCRV